MAKSKTRNKCRHKPQRKQAGGGQPASGGPKPLALDIALGRGGMANNNPGNKKSRKIIAAYHVAFFQAQQASASRRAKGIIVNSVLEHLTKEGFRFVEKVNGMWVEAPYEKARAKVIQALREGAHGLRKATVVCNDATASLHRSTPILTQESVESKSSPADEASLVSAESWEHFDTTESSDFEDTPMADNLEFISPLATTATGDWENIKPLSLSYSSNNESSDLLEPLPLTSSLSISIVEDEACLGILSGLLDLEV